MTALLDQLSDTMYREMAERILDGFIDQYGENARSMSRSQIHGLRQIAIQQPREIKSFADHQRERIEKKLETAGSGSRPKLEAQRAFWKLVADLCDPGKLDWSPASEAESWMPAELKESNIPAKSECNSNEERSRRKQLKARQKQWLEAWNADHVPAFFQRFCTHYLYHLGKFESPRS